MAIVNLRKELDKKKLEALVEIYEKIKDLRGGEWVKLYLLEHAS